MSRVMSQPLVLTMGPPIGMKYLLAHSMIAFLLSSMDLWRGTSSHPRIYLSILTQRFSPPHCHQSRSLTHRGCRLDWSFWISNSTSRILWLFRNLWRSSNAPSSFTSRPPCGISPETIDSELIWFLHPDVSLEAIGSTAQTRQSRDVVRHSFLKDSSWSNSNALRTYSTRLVSPVRLCPAQ